MSFYDELKRRHVFRIGAAYAITAWLLIQVAETIFPLFGFDETPARIVVVILAIGFVPALALAWVFQITPEGLKKDRDVDRSRFSPVQSSKRLDRIIMAMLALALTFFAIERFVLVPERTAGQIEAARQEGRSEALVRSYGDRSIAVLPFVNMSDDPDQVYFSEGISEEVLNLLARVGELRVISRSSAFTFRGDVNLREVAEKLDVDFVLEGSVRKAGNDIRVTAQLIHARTDTHIWSKAYDRALRDIFAIQDEIAGLVVAEIKPALLRKVPATRGTSEESYALYLQAQYLDNLGSPEESRQAEVLVERAVELDPEYVPALALAAILHVRKNRFELARTAIYKILLIEPGNAIANVLLGAGQIFASNDLESGVQSIERALASEPNNPAVMNLAAQMLRSIGRFDEAIILAKRASRNDPLCNICVHSLARNQLLAGHLDDAEASIRRYQGLGLPGLGGWVTLGDALLLKGDAKAALEAYEMGQDDGPYWSAARACALYTLGRQEEFDAALEELVADWSDEAPWEIARPFAWSGDVETAFEWLSYDRGLDDFKYRINFNSYLWDPFLRSLHGDPRWVELQKKAGLDSARLAGLEFTLPADPLAAPKVK